MTAPRVTRSWSQAKKHQPNADSESVKEISRAGELVSRADAVDGVESAKNPDVSEVTREIPEDDVPEEYRHASSDMSFKTESCPERSHRPSVG